ncbi:MAG: transglutaminase-like domain-containing protein [Clostridiales bacterium]|nr:transglutaminase-like domain-containing protein [Clostridiales bacterium]
MYKKQHIEVLNKKNPLTFLTDAAVLFSGITGFLLLFFSVFDKECNGELLANSLAAAGVIAVVTLILKRHWVIALIINIICLGSVIYLNYDILRVGFIQVLNFAKTHQSFILDTDIYTVFLRVSFFVFILILAFTQNLRLSFIPLLGFLGGTTAYIVVMTKPYDTSIYILYLIICLCTALYCFSSKSSRFMGFVSFALFGVCSLFITKYVSESFNEAEYKTYRENNEFISSFDQTSVVKKFYPELTVSALTNGSFLTYSINGTIDQTLMAVLTLSEYEDSFCLKSFTGDVYTDSGWSSLSDSRKSALPEKNPETIADDIASADLGSSSLLLNSSEISYYIEQTEYVKGMEFVPYFIKTKASYEEGGAFYELSSNTLTLYDLTPESVSHALYAELSVEEAETLINRERAYSDFVYDNYTDVSENLKESVENLCESINTEQLNSLTISDLKDKINENIAFTLMPETSETGQDPMAFALETGEADSNRLASLGVMALRYLGFPARYAEGIAVSTEQKETAGKVNGSYKIDIYNTDAIAFCEVYVDGFGWLPVNFLPDNAAEIIEDEINAINAEKSSDLSEHIKTTASPYIKKTAKAFSAFAAAALAAAAVLTLLRRFVIIFIRSFKINRGNKNILYGYTEKIKAFFDENIFEETVLGTDLDELFYSPNPKGSVKSLYSRVKALTKTNLKSRPLSKKLSALFLKVII